MSKNQMNLMDFKEMFNETEILKSFDETIENLLTDNRYKDLIEIKNKLHTLLKYAIDKNMSLMPNIIIKERLSEEEKLNQYLSKWCKKFIEDRLKDSVSKGLKDYGETDSALITKVKYFTNESDDNVNKYLKGHFLFMSAENNNGNMLEEFLASVLEDFGWIWCSGSCYQAIDFINVENEILLQVKNKYNTENSSSNKVRAGTTIIKWNRLNRPSKGTNIPIPNWEALHTMINDDEINQLLTEEKYLDFIRIQNANK